MKAWHEIIQPLSNLTFLSQRKVRNDTTCKFAATRLLGLKSMFNVLSDFINFNMLSTTNYCSLKSNETVFIDFSCLLEKTNNDHYNV